MLSAKGEPIMKKKTRSNIDVFKPSIQGYNPQGKVKAQGTPAKAPLPPASALD